MYPSIYLIYFSLSTLLAYQRNLADFYVDTYTTV